MIRQRDIIHRKAVLQRLADLDPALAGPKLRQAVLALFKDVLAQGRAEVRRRFDEGASGMDTIHAQAFLMDQLIRVIYDFILARVYPLPNPTAAEHICVAAVGGYGRAELAPHSDIDLLFLLPYKQTPHGEQVVEYMLYLLWDLGLKVGHSTRSIDECIRQAKADLTIRTALLEARYLWGERKLFDQMRKRFLAEVVAGSGVEFVEAKLGERDTRHDRLGDSRYLVEPNVKEGKGGLRDLQTLFWLGKYLYQVDDPSELVAKGVLSADEAAKFAKAENFLWTVRCHLHYLTDRPEDRLTFDMQPEIGRRMNYTEHAGTLGVERFMKHYFLVAKDVGDLTRIFCAALEAKHQRRPKFRLLTFPFRRNVQGFRLDGDRLTVTAADAFAQDPIQMIRLFHVAQENGLDIHPHALRLITQNLRSLARLRAEPEANRLFLEILTSRKDPETALKQMNEAGVFGKLIPDFGRIVAQMQHDMYHVYTVDEHTIRAIGMVHKIESGQLAEEVPVSTEVIHKVVSRRALYAAVLMHDIAKGRGGDHSRLGAKVALKLGPRLGLSAEETEQVAWLVEHHLLMSDTAFKRDINDPQTIRDFVAIVQSPERLRLLLVLTVADIRAVGPNVWNGWKATLLRELYFRSEELMAGVPESKYLEVRAEAAKMELRQALKDWSDERFHAFAALPYPNYWLALDAATQARHAAIVCQAETEKAPLTVRWRVDQARGGTEVTVYTADHPGLFSQIAGAMAVGGASIVEAKIFTMTNGMALDTFWIQDAEGGAFDEPDRLERLGEQVAQALSGRLRPARELEKRAKLPARTRVFRVPVRVLVDNAASKTHTVIEVNCRDRAGLLHQVTGVLTDLSLQISSALISTYGERVVDVFYVKDVFGFKVEHGGKIAQIKARLEEALKAPEDEEAPRRRRAGSTQAAQ